MRRESISVPASRARNPTKPRSLLRNLYFDDDVRRFALGWFPRDPHVVIGIGGVLLGLDGELTRLGVACLDRGGIQRGRDALAVRTHRGGEGHVFLKILIFAGLDLHDLRTAVFDRS